MGQDSSEMIGEAVKKGAERINILYYWRRDWLLLYGKRTCRSRSDQANGRT
jgi:hypothetical protein